MDLTDMKKGQKTHNYKTVNSELFNTIDDCANSMAEHGWRVVGVINNDTRHGPNVILLLERPVGVYHPNDI